MSRDFPELDLQLVMFDFNDTEEEREDNVVAGVAIRPEDVEAFAADVERLAVEKHGGATFNESLDPRAQSETLKLLAADERVSASYWFGVLFGDLPFSEE